MSHAEAALIASVNTHHDLQPACCCELSSAGKPSGGAERSVPQRCPTQTGAGAAAGACSLRCRTLCPCWCAPRSPASVLMGPFSLLLDWACEQSCERGRGSFTRDPEKHEVTARGCSAACAHVSWSAQAPRAVVPPTPGIQLQHKVTAVQKWHLCWCDVPVGLVGTLRKHINNLKVKGNLHQS